MVYLVRANTGENAVFVNGEMIVDGGNEDFSARLVEQIAERLASALNVALSVRTITPPSPAWTWEGESGRLGLTSGVVCQKCGSSLVSGMCKDVTCPYSDWPQSVSLEDVESLSGDCIAAKYGLIRAEVHSDDYIYESCFFAEPWFLEAGWQALADLEDDGWGDCEAADRVVLDLAYGGNEEVGKVFEYINRHNNGCSSSEKIGYGCSVNASDALVWWRKNRYGSFALRMARQGKFEVSWSGDKWAWDCDGKSSGFMFPSREEAAIGAVIALELDSEYDPGQPLYRLSVPRPDSEALVSVVGLPFLMAKFNVNLRLVRGEQMDVTMENGTRCLVIRI